MKPTSTKTLFERLSNADVKNCSELDKDALVLSKHLVKSLNIRDEQTMELPISLNNIFDIARYINKNYHDQLTLLSLHTL